MSSRAQSSTLGTMLLVGLVVVGVSLAAVFGGGILLSGGANTAKPSVAVSAEVTDAGGGEKLVVTHVDGDSLDPETTTVVVVDGGSSGRVPLSSFALSGTGDGSFDPGDSASLTRDFQGGAVELRLVDEGSQTLLQTLSVSVPGGAVPTVDFSTVSLDPHAGGQSSGDAGGVTVEDGGTTVNMTGNWWRTVPLDETVTEDTVLTFEFKSTSEGDIHAIGLENDGGQSSDLMFRLFGTQNWGRDGFDDYETDDGWKRYTIPVGELYADDGKDLSSFDRLAFVMDCEPNHCDGSSDAKFRNVRVHNGTD